MKPKTLLQGAALFALFSIHTCVFALFQWNNTFFSSHLRPHSTLLKALLYFFAIAFCFSYQRLARRLGIKKMLLGAFFLNALGLGCVAIDQFLVFPTSSLFIYLAMVLIGSALLTVFNCLVTFIIITFPKRTGAAIAILCGFGNLGILLSIFYLLIVAQLSAPIEAYLILWLLMALALWAIQNLFQEAPYPEKYQQLRANSLLFRLMPLRILLYCLAMCFYALTESAIGVWGRLYTMNFLPLPKTWDIVILFWSGMTLGQFAIAGYIDYPQPKKFFFAPLLLILASFLFLPLETHTSQVMVSFLFGGLGCSVIFPLILTRLESEIIKVSFEERQGHFLPFIESGMSFLVGSYLLGVAVNDFWMSLFPSTHPTLHFVLGALFILLTAAFLFYLRNTKPPLSDRSYLG